MKGYHIYIPNYSVGADCYKEIPWVTRKYGIDGSELEITDFVWYGGEASYENVEMLMETEAVKNADMIFAVGGGRVMDTCKVVRERLDKPMFTFPTLGSNCAATTSIAVIYHPD